MNTESRTPDGFEPTTGQYQAQTRQKTLCKTSRTLLRR